MLSTVAGQETRQSSSSWAKAQERGNLLENLLRCISSKSYSVLVKRVNKQIVGYPIVIPINSKAWWSARQFKRIQDRIRSPRGLFTKGHRILGFLSVYPPFLLASELGLGLARLEQKGLVELDRFLLTCDI